jgi:hypothetical protein
MISRIGRRDWRLNAEIRAIGACIAKFFILHDPFYAADSSCRPLKLPSKPVTPQALLRGLTHWHMQAPDQRRHHRILRRGIKISR